MVVCELGECVWHLRPGTKGVEKFEVRWRDGVFLGVRDDSGEVIIGTPEGVIKVSAIRRKGTMGDRWDRDRIMGVVGVPWAPIPGREDDRLRSRVSFPKEGPPKELQ